MDGELIIVIITLVLVGIPVAITDIVISTQDTSCNITDQIGLNVSQYLLGVGISELIIIFLLLIFLGIGNCIPDNDCLHLAFITKSIGYIFGMIWFIIGGVILFRSNMDCIKSGGSMIVYALVVWILTGFSFMNKYQRTNDDDEYTPV